MSSVRLPYGMTAGLINTVKQADLAHMLNCHDVTQTISLELGCIWIGISLGSVLNNEIDSG